jgi:uncharacterized membrane protein YuzA (DUF378 family)
VADKLLNHQLRVGIWLIVAIAAANWALVKFANTDLLVDLLGFREDMLTLAYAVIGAASGVNLYNIAVGEFVG